MFRNVGAILKKMDQHIAKRCKYCDFELGEDVPIASFVGHLEEIHQDKVDGKDMRDFKSLQL